MPSLFFVSCSPNTANAHKALQLAVETHKQNPAQSLHVFFYSEAAYVANANNWTNATTSLQKEWQALAEHDNVTLSVCVSTAISRGISDTHNSKRHKLVQTAVTTDGQQKLEVFTNNLATGFELVGLGVLAEQLVGAEHIVCVDEHAVNSVSAQADSNANILLILDQAISKLSEEALLAVFALASFDHSVQIAITHKAVAVLTEKDNKVLSMLASMDLYDIENLWVIDAPTAHNASEHDEIILKHISSENIQHDKYDLLWSV